MRIVARPARTQPERLGGTEGGGLGPNWNGSVTCLSVSDNRAVVGFSGTLSSDCSSPSRVWSESWTGRTGSAQDTIEWAEVQGQLGGEPIPGPTDCSSYPSTFSPGVIHVNQQGDIVVADAPPPLPTSKDQCKKNGWRNYTVQEPGRLRELRRDGRQEPTRGLRLDA